VDCGRAIRVLSVVDAYTRECLALEVDTSFASRRVTRVLDTMACEHEPKHGKGLCNTCYARALYRATHPPKPKPRSRCEHEPKHGNGLCLKRYNLAWDGANPQRALARAERYRKRDPTKGPEWKKNNPDKVREESRKRRALKRGCTEHFTEAEFEALKKALGNR